MNDTRRLTEEQQKLIDAQQKIIDALAKQLLSLGEHPAIYPRPYPVYPYPVPDRVHPTPMPWFCEIYDSGTTDATTRLTYRYYDKNGNMRSTKYLDIDVL